MMTKGEAIEYMRKNKYKRVAPPPYLTIVSTYMQEMMG